jgi:hypothetical protein
MTRFLNKKVLPHDLIFHEERFVFSFSLIDGFLSPSTDFHCTDLCQSMQSFSTFLREKFPRVVRSCGKDQQWNHTHDHTRNLHEEVFLLLFARPIVIAKLLERNARRNAVASRLFGIVGSCEREK